MTSALPSRLMVVMFTDIFDSVGMKSRLGDEGYVALLRRHNEIAEGLRATMSGCEKIKGTGDGFLLRFPGSAAAVRFGLAFQRALSEEKWEGEPVLVRVGIHAGEATELSDDRGGVDVIGLAVDMSARVMGLSRPGQVLMTQRVFDDARQYASQIEAKVLDRDADASHAHAKDRSLVRWLAHGPYLIKGSDEPIEVFEVGIVGRSPLKEPPDGDKARRVLRFGEDETLGWRPAEGLDVPRRAGWKLLKKLGDGGFGEVWLAESARVGEKRVYKFCFDADKVRSLRRELTLFRILREQLGDRRDISRIFDVQLEPPPPFFLESEFAELGDLKSWAASKGGLEAIGLEERLRILRQTAEALGAAHGVGVLHRDIKPTNIFMYRGDDGAERPRLGDFGIAQLTDAARTKNKDITLAGFTQTEMSGTVSTAAGTQMYLPPEVHAGQGFTVQGDIYALGVLLYQLVVGDFKKPLGHGWEEDVRDPLVRSDIERCVSADPGERFASVAELAKNLRELPARRQRRRNRRAARWGAIMGAAAVVTFLVTGWFMDRAARERKELAYRGFLEGVFKAANPRHYESPDPGFPELITIAATKVSSLQQYPDIKGEVLLTLGELFREHSMVPEAESHLRQALLLLENELGPDSALAGEAHHQLGMLLRGGNGLSEAKHHFDTSLGIARKHFGEESEEYARNVFERSVIFRRTNELELCESELERSIGIRRRVISRGGDTKLIEIELARSMNSKALLLRELGRFAEATVAAEESLKQRRKLLSDDHPDTWRSMNTLAHLDHAVGELERAAETHRNVWNRRRMVLGENHRETAAAAQDLAVVLLDLGQLKEAETISNGIRLTRMNQKKDAEPAEHAGANTEWISSLWLQGMIQWKRGMLSDAEGTLRNAAGLCAHRVGDQWQNGEVYLALGGVLLDLRKAEATKQTAAERVHTLAEAEKILRIAHDGLTAHKRTLPTRLEECRRCVHELYDRMGYPENASEFD